jgi:hypothetical protein
MISIHLHAACLHLTQCLNMLCMKGIISLLGTKMLPCQSGLLRLQDAPTTAGPVEASAGNHALWLIASISDPRLVDELKIHA